MKRSSKVPAKKSTKATPKQDAAPAKDALKASLPSPFTSDPRLPAIGTTFQRAYKGKVLEITVRENGFLCNGETYRSLSALARKVTGAKSINGLLFFRLTKTATKPAASSAKPVKGTPEQVASVSKARQARAAKVAARKATKAS